LPEKEEIMNAKRAIVCATVTVLLALSWCGGAAQELDVRRHNLENGLTVLTLEDHTLPVASFYVFFKVGSRNEKAGLTGISHFFEHMMFNGAAKYGPKEFDQVLESNGGYSNAWTSTDMTVYYEDFPSDKIEIIMDLESDRMANLALAQDLIDSEREVVKEERRLVVDNYLPGRMEEALFAAAFTAHPYHWSVIGWMSDINNIAREDMIEYFETYYAPNNAIVVIVGDIDTDRTMGLMRDYFSPIDAGPEPRIAISTEPEQVGERRVEVVKPAQNEQFMTGYHVPALGAPDALVLDVVQTILSHGESSKLYKRLVYEEQIALDVGIDYAWRMDPGLFYFHVEMKPGVAASKGEDLLYDTVEEMKREPVSDHDLQKAKNILEADFLRSLKTNNGRARRIGYFETMLGDYTAMFGVRDSFKAVTADDVMAAMNKYFDPKNRTVVTLIPEQAGD
jgi:predicted Zn-dependent peptidase